MYPLDILPFAPSDSPVSCEVRRLLWVNTATLASMHVRVSSSGGLARFFLLLVDNSLVVVAKRTEGLHV